jgi:hypothetical protein
MMPPQLAQLASLDHFKINSLVTLLFYHICVQLSVKPYELGSAGQGSEEYDYIEDYDRQYGGSALAKRKAEAKARKEALVKRQEEIRIRSADEQRLEQNRIDSELA